MDWGWGCRWLDSGGQGEEAGEDRTGYLWMLEGCINAAVLGCLDAGVPMRDVVGAVAVGVLRHPRVTKSGVSQRSWSEAELLVQPAPREKRQCASLHVFAFTGDGQLVLAESEGKFDVDKWGRAERVARRAVVGRNRGGGEAKGQTAGQDTGMNGHQDHEQETDAYFEGQDLLEDGSILETFRRCVEERVARDERWKGG